MSPVEWMYLISVTNYHNPVMKFQIYHFQQKLRYKYMYWVTSWNNNSEFLKLNLFSRLPKPTIVYIIFLLTIVSEEIFEKYMYTYFILSNGGWRGHTCSLHIILKSWRYFLEKKIFQKCQHWLFYSYIEQNKHQ